MIPAVAALLAADATLAALLPGGIHDATAVGEISRQTMPGAFDGNAEIQPCALVRAASTSPVGPYDDAARLVFSVFLYERVGYGTIQAARRRVVALLNVRKVTPDDGSRCWEVRLANEVRQAGDSALGCSLEVATFVATVRG